QGKAWPWPHPVFFTVALFYGKYLRACVSLWAVKTSTLSKMPPAQEQREPHHGNKYFPMATTAPKLSFTLSPTSPRPLRTTTLFAPALAGRAPRLLCIGPYDYR
ncbi:unnamed protein product, partial [Ectocarpus sp. 12 AP-2014]